MAAHSAIGVLLEGQLEPGQKRVREEEAAAAVAEKKWPGWPGDNVFRLIVPVHKVGSIIGRKGELIKKMCEETKARIKILEGIPGTPERVVMVSAREEPEAAVSPAMDGVMKVLNRLTDGLEVDGDASSARALGGIVSFKLLVPATQAGSLIGRQGTTIKSIQDVSGALVRVVSVEEVPLCALPDDRVVEIQGDSLKVHKALELVLTHLRRFLVDRSILPLFELNRPPQTQGQQATLTPWSNTTAALTSSIGSGLGGTSHFTTPLPHDSYYPHAEAFDSQSHHQGLSMYGRDPGVGGMNAPVAPPPPAPIITQVIQKMQIPLSYADAIIGTAGANISYMRRTSGATIIIQETRGVIGEMTVEISGTSSQVQTAQQLIQNYMAGTALPVSSYTPVEVPYGSYNSPGVYSGTGGATGFSGGSYGSSFGAGYTY